MNQSELRGKYPVIANTFEKIIYEPINAKKYRFLIYNYRKRRRGISFEKIFDILNEHQFIVKLEPSKKWYQEW